MLFYVKFLKSTHPYITPVSDRYHVVLKDNLARQSRDQNHKSQKHSLYWILQENVSKPWFLQLLSMIWQFWR